MSYITLITGIILLVLVLLQVGDGGLNVALTNTLQAPVERRGTAKTLYNLTILTSIVFIVSAILHFLFA